MTSVVELTTGSQVWFDGEVWTIAEFGSGAVTLTSGQSIRTVSISMLATSARPMVEPATEPKDRELVPIVLGMLDSKVLAEFESRAAHVRSVLDAPCARQGDRALAIERKAAELNVSGNDSPNTTPGCPNSTMLGSHRCSGPASCGQVTETPPRSLPQPRRWH